MLSRPQPAAATSATRLPEGEVEELRRLVETYWRLRSAVKDTHVGADEQVKLLQRRLGTVKWTDLGEAELCTIELLDDATVRAHLASRRRRMHEVIGDTRNASYLVSSADANAETTSSPMLRADLAECISTVNYFYGAYGVAASSRPQVTVALMRYAVWILGALAVAGIGLTYSGRLHLTLPVAALEYMLLTSAAAVLGSTISVQRRLQDAVEKKDGD